MLGILTQTYRQPFCAFSAVVAMKMHTKARTSPYPGNGPDRATVPESKVLWSQPYPDYAPVTYTAPVVLKGPVWADIDVPTTTPETPLKFNELDGKVDRRSHEGKYEVVDGLPRNPHGRTGMVGRGLLGRWGPNQAADPIVTRWAKDAKGVRMMEDGVPVLEFVAIQRKDTGEWAIPGGMVEPGDTVSATLKKEFGEEALNTMEMAPDKAAQLEADVTRLFANGKEVYRGYVDDPRNTDNAWMETVAMNFHDEGKTFDSFPLEAGDDAAAVKWMRIYPGLDVYASHGDFLEAVAKLHGALF